MRHTPYDGIHLICDTIPAAALAVDAASHIRFITKAAQALLGQSGEALIGQPLTALLTNQADVAHTAIIATLQTGAVSVVREALLHCSDRVASLSFDIVPLFGRQKKIIGALAIIRDIRAQNEADQRLRHLEALSGIGEMAAGTIHEIRNPLTSINGFVQLLRTRASRQNDFTSMEYCSLITGEVNRINTILSDFLTLAKPQDNKFSKVNVNSLTRDVLNLIYGEAIISEIEIRRNLPADELFILGSGEKLKEVMINICRNAFQAMQAGGVLELGLSGDDANVYVDLIDTGHGIPEAIRADIFKPFFTTKANGTGLGLAICERIINEHDGKIKVASAPGVGTTFTLVLPRLK